MRATGSRSVLDGARRLFRRAPSPFRAWVFRMLSALRASKLVVARKVFRMRRHVSRRPGFGRKAHGVNLVADARSVMSGGAIARGVAVALDAAEIPYDIIDQGRSVVSGPEDTTFVHKEVSRSRYDVSVICTNPDGFVRLRAHLPVEVLGSCYVILYSFWELPEFPESWLHAFRSIDEYWAGSRFIQEAAALKSPVPVVRIPPVVHLNTARQFSRAALGLPEGRFLFLTMADTLSVLERKNPLGAIRAFKKAFSGTDAGVGLVLKLNNPDHVTSPSWQSIVDEIGDCGNIYVLGRVLAGDEVTSLLAHSGCYVSLHRSEGFGLVPAEAMSLGKPVILTNWSGNTDYMTRDNSIGIDYELVEISADYGNYERTQHWAEPDIEQAAYWMKRIYEEPELARGIGLRGQETIRSEYSAAAVGRLIRRRLEYIRRPA